MTARSVAIKAAVPLDTPEVSAIDISQLIALSLKSLPFMFDAKSGLFCHRLKRENSNMIQEGLSPRYSIMVCLGLERCKSAGLDVGMDTLAIVRALLQNTNWIDDLGDLGLLLWLCAASAPGELAGFCSRNDVNGALARFPQAREGRTMQLAWFLTGLSYAASTSKKFAGALEGQAAE